MIFETVDDLVGFAQETPRDSQALQWATFQALILIARQLERITEAVDAVAAAG